MARRLLAARALPLLAAALLLCFGLAFAEHLHAPATTAGALKNECPLCSLGQTPVGAGSAVPVLLRTAPRLASICPAPPAAPPAEPPYRRHARAPPRA